MKKIVTIILVMAITFMFSACGIKTFQSSALIKIEDNNPYPTIDNGTYTNLLKSNTAITKISENLDFEISNRELKNSIVLQNIDIIGGSFEIIVSHTDEEMAEQILNALLEEYPLILKEYSSDLNLVVISKSTDKVSKK